LIETGYRAVREIFSYLREIQTEIAPHGVNSKISQNLSRA